MEHLLNAEKKKYKNNILADVCSGLIFHLVFATLFGLYTKNVEHHTVACEDSELMKWSKGLFVLHAISFLFSIVLLPLITCIALRSSNTTTIKTSIYFATALRSALGLVLFIAFIGLCVAYQKNEACGDLRSLSLAYFLLTGVCLGLVALVLTCCCLCLCCIPLIAGKESFTLTQAGGSKNYGAI